MMWVGGDDDCYVEMSCRAIYISVVCTISYTTIYITIYIYIRRNRSKPVFVTE